VEDAGLLAARGGLRVVGRGAVAHRRAGLEGSDGGEVLVAAELVDEVRRNGVGDRHAFGEGDTVGDLPQDHRHRNAQRGADGGEQLRGSFLLSALHLGKVPERYACGGGDLTQRTSLPLARATKDVTNLSS